MPPKKISEQIRNIFSIMALLILLIACFNLANTSMALMATRVREIGVRKVMGGGTKQVFLQFLFETSFTSLLAILVGMAIFTWMADWLMKAGSIFFTACGRITWRIT